MILTGIWPLINFTTKLIVVDEITVREVSNCTIATKFFEGPCERKTLEECSKCEEIVKNYTVGENTIVKCRVRTNPFNITQKKKNLDLAQDTRNRIYWTWRKNTDVTRIIKKKL